jgi:hypothetical protein|tara:strand:+ start:2814 stop:3221 length:408 start_codon:yes stop_codon:yes gene_type:complete
MAVKLDNLDDVLKQLARLETAVTTEVIREARKNMKATVRKYIPVFKKITPVGTTGEMAKSLKIRSRSRRGVSNIMMKWEVPYGYYVNFDPAKKSQWFASDKYRDLKGQLDKEGVEDVRDAFKTVFKKHGVKVIEE